MFTERLEV